MQPSYLYNLISVQPHRSTRSSDVVTLSHPPSSSSLKVNNRSFGHASACLWNQLSKELRLPTTREDLSLSSESHTSVRHFLHHHCHHPLLLLSSTPGSKLIFSTNPFLRSSSTFPPTVLTAHISAVSRFSRACHVGLTVALCARLSWLLVTLNHCTSSSSSSLSTVGYVGWWTSLHRTLTATCNLVASACNTPSQTLPNAPWPIDLKHRSYSLLNSRFQV